MCVLSIELYSTIRYVQWDAPFEQGFTAYDRPRTVCAEEGQSRLNLLQTRGFRVILGTPLAKEGNRLCLMLLKASECVAGQVPGLGGRGGANSGELGEGAGGASSRLTLFHTATSQAYWIAVTQRHVTIELFLIVTGGMIVGNDFVVHALCLFHF